MVAVYSPDFKINLQKNNIPQSPHNEPGHILFPQRLSIILWLYNAKIILERLSVDCSDDVLDFLWSGGFGLVLG